jgi:cytochrome P450
MVVAKNGQLVGRPFSQSVAAKPVGSTGECAAEPKYRWARMSPARAFPVGPPLSLPVQSLLFWRQLDRFLRGCKRRYGPVFTLRVAPWGTIVVVSEPAEIKRVLTGDPELWRAGESYDLLAPLIGERSVVVLDGAEHLRVRKQLLPPFHGDMMSRYERLIETIAAEEVASWPVGRPIALIERMRAITLEVMLQAVIGVEEAQRLGALRQALARAVQLRPLLLLMWVWQPLKQVGPWRAFNRQLELARRLLREEIERRRADPSVERRSDILSVLICAGELDDRELLDQLATLLLAGHDTSTTALAWAIERLVRHPAALLRAREDSSYLDAVVKETLRLRPVLPAITRRAGAPVEVAGYQLPAGVTVMPCIRLLHLSADLYPDPQTFEPERFLDGQGQGYAWIPFGGGTHRCIGAAFASFQMGIVLRTILAHAELRADRPKDESIRSEHIMFVPSRGSRVVKTSQRPVVACVHPGGARIAAPGLELLRCPARGHGVHPEKPLRRSRHSVRQVSSSQ